MTKLNSLKLAVGFVGLPKEKSLFRRPPDLSSGTKAPTIHPFYDVSFSHGTILPKVCSGSEIDSGYHDPQKTNNYIFDDFLTFRKHFTHAKISVSQGIFTRHFYEISHRQFAMMRDV